MLNLFSLDKVYTKEYTFYGGGNMVNMITLKKLRPGLPEVIRGIDTKLERYIVIKRGRPVAIMIGPDDYESLLETIDILSDKEAVKRIIAAKKEIAENKTISLEELRQRIEK
jgi:PHD/YefM family antitoxin component YafN of YafNO toxin-antitoxin module